MSKRLGPAKKLIFFLFGLTLLISCEEGEPFTIEGSLPDTSFDGEWVYMVPTVKGQHDKVDSTQIKDAKFSFQGKVTDPEIFVIRTRPFLRIMLQELIVVKEQGETKAYLGQNGIVKGTLLNDSLQSWSEYRQMFDEQVKLLDLYYYAGTQAQRDSLTPMINAVAFEKNLYHFTFASNNRENVVGKMVIRMMQDTFSPEQKIELGIK